MAKLSVWVAECHEVEIDDTLLIKLKKDLDNRNRGMYTKEYVEFRSELDKKFSAGYNGEREIVGIYDEDGDVIGIG